MITVYVMARNGVLRTPIEHHGEGPASSTLRAHDRRSCGFLCYFHGGGLGWRIVLSAPLQVQGVGELWKGAGLTELWRTLAAPVFFLRRYLVYLIFKTATEHASQRIESC